MYCSGTRIIPLCFGSKSYDWNFHLALVSAPIFGADFLRQHYLPVDMAGRRVLESSTLNSIGESFFVLPGSWFSKGSSVVNPGVHLRIFIRFS